MPMQFADGTIYPTGDPCSQCGQMPCICWTYNYPSSSMWSWSETVDYEKLRQIIREEIRNMATVHSCDKCGEYIPSYTLKENTAVVPSLAKETHPETKDLCRSCIAKLRTHLGMDLDERIVE